MTQPHHSPQHAPHHAPEHSPHGRAGHGPAAEDHPHEGGLAELLDLDGRLGASVLQEAIDAAAAVLDSAPRRIVDLGAGTGTGTLALALRFPGARIHALDASAAMLDRLGVAAATAGVADRVEPVETDLDGDWPAELAGGADLTSSIASAGSVDLAWAALSLHHVTDPAQVLRQVFDVLRPGGALVVTEFTGATSYEPGDLGTGTAGLGERIVSALAAEGYPVSAEWTAALAEAGFSPVTRHESTFAASARTPDGARYLGLQLAMNRTLLGGRLDPADLHSLDAATAALTAGTAELEFTSGRAVWIAVRPDTDGTAAHPGNGVGR